MTDALPILVLMWLATRGNGGGSSAATARSPAAPSWPTPKSPPPPLRAFKAQKNKPKPPPSADATHTSTPLAELHASPPEPAPASAIDTAKAKATAAIRKRTTQLLKKQAARFNPFAKKAAVATSTALVSNLQQILANHGVPIAKDGLYGPRTASAWSALAKRKGLAPSISREGPKIAKVVTETFERLQTPPIP